MNRTDAKPPLHAGDPIPAETLNRRLKLKTSFGSPILQAMVLIHLTEDVQRMYAKIAACGDPKGIAVRDLLSPETRTMRDFTPFMACILTLVAFELADYVKEDK